MVNRQIHLDFHTSGIIGDIAGKFNSDIFIQTLKAAEVGGICLFARCHHGYCYYPTKNGTPHPNLKEPDLLGKQLKACKDAGIQPSIYTTICWDELSASKHPEWLAISSDNQIMKINSHTGQQLSKFEPGWQFLCWNSPYRDYFKEHIKDLLSQYTCPYLFLDILFHPTACVCLHCVNRLKDKGFDPENPHDRERNSIDSAREFMHEVNGLIYSFDPAIKPFYNSRLRVTGIVEDGSLPEFDSLGYICIESLPSGPWGYDHFPIFAKYFQNLAKDKPIMGHTGKFQKMWGDFGGLKNQAALDYEVIRMMSHGVAASVGDQLHPDGHLDQATYELIGNTFAKVKDFENILLPSEPIDEIGVLLTNQPKIAKNIGTILEPETGVLKMLTQLQYQFSFIDEQSDFDSYKLIILPDEIKVTDNLKSKFKTYLKNGGKIIASYASGLDQQNQWSFDDLMIRIKGDYKFKPYYFYPCLDLKNASVIADTDHIQYLGGKDVEILSDRYQVCAKITDPYFNRAWNHFCSHAQTPPASRSGNPEMIYNGQNLIYFASPVFTCYNQFGNSALKKIVDWSIRKLLVSKLIESNLPSTAEVTLRKNSNGQKILTVLNYIHQRRGYNLDIVEDVILLSDVMVSMNIKGRISMVFDACKKKELSFKQCDERVMFTIPCIEGFTVIKIY